VNLRVEDGDVGNWKSLFAPIAVTAAAALVAVIARPPKIAASVEFNPPHVYLPVFAAIFVFWVIRLWRMFRNP
jgi:hypothetical protein